MCWRPSGRNSPATRDYFLDATLSMKCCARQVVGGCEMRLPVFAIAVLASGLALVGCTTSAIKAAPVSQLSTQSLCSNAGRDCPIGYYSLARTYLKIDITPKGKSPSEASDQSGATAHSAVTGATGVSAVAPATPAPLASDAGQASSGGRAQASQSAVTSPGADSAAAAARGSVSVAQKACQAVAAEQASYITSWLSKYPANRALLTRAESLEARLPDEIRELNYPSADEEIDEEATEEDQRRIAHQNVEYAEARRSADQAYEPFAALVEATIADLATAVPLAEAGIKPAEERTAVFSSLCVPQVTITVTPQTVYDGRRYALFGAGDLLSDDTVKITLAQGGLKRIDLSAADQSAAIIEAAGTLLSFPTRLASLQRSFSGGLTDELDDIVVTGSRIPGEDELKHWVARVSLLQDLIARLDNALAVPSVLDGENELRRNQRLALVGSNDEVPIWPGVFARAACPTIPDLSEGGAVANQSGVWVATPIACRFELVDQGRRVLRAEPFAGFDGSTAEPLSLARTRFSDRNTAYDFSSGHMTAANLTAPSPVAVVLGLPLRVIEGVAGSISAGVKGESGVITAQKDLIAAQTEMLTAQTGLLQAQAALDAQRRAEAETEVEPD